MKQRQYFNFTSGVIGFPLLFVLLIWFVFWVEVRFGYRLHTWGIYPRRLLGLKGVVLSPFLHSNIAHVYQNTIPLFVLSLSLFYFYRPLALKVIIYGVLFSGFLTWCIGRPAYHIGISGLIYVLFSFVFFKGLFAKHFRLIALSLSIIFFYGSMVWYVFPIKEGMSWEGHLSGLIVGFIFALYFKEKLGKAKIYNWEEPLYNEEEDAFMKHFDANGNFIEDIENESIDETINHTKPSTIINYSYKPSSKDDI